MDAGRLDFRLSDSFVSEKTYNLIIGAMLLWGFGLNYLMVTLWSDAILSWFSTVNPFVFLICYILCVIVGSLLIHKTGSVGSFTGYTMIAAPIGILLCAYIDGISVDIVQSAVLVTAIVTLGFMILATIFPDTFLRMGRMLFYSLLFLVVAELLTALFFKRFPMIYEWLGVGLFSLYIGYDWSVANHRSLTVDNAIDSAAELYLDIINLFIRILSIMARNRDN